MFSWYFGLAILLFYCFSQNIWMALPYKRKRNIFVGIMISKRINSISVELISFTNVLKYQRDVIARSSKCDAVLLSMFVLA